MLLAAEAGDVLFVSGGRHFRFLGDGSIRLDGIVYSEFDGAYNAGWQTNDGFFNVTLPELYKGANGNTWGGWYRIQDNSVVAIYPRESTMLFYPPFEPNVVGRAASHGAAGGAIGATACLPIGVAAGAGVWGAVASATTGVVSALLPEFYHLQRGEILVKSAGHNFVYALNYGLEYNATVNQATPVLHGFTIRMYGSHTYRMYQDLSVR